ncbi:MAG: hypothetical protein RQ826_07755 [Xanthomonadales bacterium]|nr:hypothetical protein [Xanthomonadales bacterium]
MGGLVAGELFALLWSHAINAELKAAWTDVLALSGQAATQEIAARFEEIRHLATERARAMSIHSHFGPYGLLAVGLGVVKNRLGHVGRLDMPAAVLMIGGGLAQTLGFLTLGYQSAAWFSLSNAGVALLLTGIGLYVPGLLSAASQARALPQLKMPGGWLLRTGAALVFAGLLFGLFLAWRHVFFEEPGLHVTLLKLIEAIRVGEMDAANKFYASYKSAQIRMAITAAAHSHAVAFGFIMILTALLAEHLRLTKAWRNPAFALIAVGGLLLPVFVYLAPRFGYFYALCADSAGGLVIIGLLVVLAGLRSRQEVAP